MCLEREQKGRGRTKTIKRRPRLTSVCMIAPKRQDHLPVPEQESAPRRGFLPASQSFVIDHDPSVEFTITSLAPTTFLKAGAFEIGHLCPGSRTSWLMSSAIEISTENESVEANAVRAECVTKIKLT